VLSDLRMSRRRWLNDRRRAERLLARKSGLRLNLGCGERAVPGWVNIDAMDLPGVDLRWDLRDPLPCDSGSVELVYSEHVLEHLEYEDVRPLVAELFRVLGRGGRLRLGVPDAERYLKAYVSQDVAFFEAVCGIGNPAVPLDSPLKVINQMFRMGGAHRYAWDFDTLSSELGRAGFVAMSRWPPGVSARDGLCLDDPSHAIETLYVEADRP
jgi:predicted SAM-dependent methyltransferase